MMDDNTTTSTSTSQDQISFLFAANQEETRNQQQQMHRHPFSSCYQHHYPLERGSGGEDSGPGSEEGLEVPEEPAKPAPHRAGSKRSRAAEVHNLSEKMRRSRINEKMKALQTLIPNSNKTDKASMLDEAIEYLKQLQLQVQMLSMRNGLASHHIYLPGVIHPLQASQLCMSFADHTSSMNLGVLGMLPLNQNSSVNNSFGPTSQCTTSHQPVMTMLPTASISALESSFAVEHSKSHHASFQLRIPSEETFMQDAVSQQQLDPGRTTGNLSGCCFSSNFNTSSLGHSSKRNNPSLSKENLMKTMDTSSSLHFGERASSSLEHNDHMENVISKDQPDIAPNIGQNFDGLQVSPAMMSSEKLLASDMQTIG